ncbi:MAG: AAA family ATPase [Terracidiphilus sp.]|jgi:pilus assembly protein CpaE
MRPVQKIPGAKGAGDLSIALIGPEERRRKAVADALAEYQTSQKRDPKGLGREVRPSGTSLPAGDGRQALTVGIQIWEFPAYPDGIDDLPRMLQQQFDVVIVDLDSNPEYALEIVESICSSSNAAVMVYSEQADLHLAVRFMRAGAREFLTLPLAHDDIAGALARVSIRQPASRLDQKATGSLFVFLGAKGGCGVTTIASNFALALAQESGQNTLLIDFGLPLGDAAINLGMATEYSTANALQDFSRLDANFLSGLLAKHSSGLNVLAAPSEFNQIQTSKEAVDKLLGVARANFDYVVVDFGSRLDLKDSDLFADSAMLYLITQVGVSELRNANRLISHFFVNRGRDLQIVLNRYIPHSLGLDDKHISKALTRPAQWTIPDDYATARRTRNTANPIVLEDSPISRAITKMARTACGLPAEAPGKKRFKIFS